MSWKTESIPDFVFFQEGPGLRNWQWTDEGMKVINVKNILGDGVGSVDTTNSDKYISSTEFESKYKHFEVEDGDIVVASSGNTYGKVGRIEQNNLPLMMNTSVIRFRSKDERFLNNEFLYCFLRSPLFKNQIEQFVTGGAQPNFGPTHLKKMAIPVPPLRVQQSIGELVCQYDHLLSNNKRRIELLEESARQLYKEWFVRFLFPGHEHVKIVDGVPEGWDKCQVGDLLTLQRGFDLPVKNRIEGSVPIYASTGINGYHNEAKVKAPGIVTGRSGSLGTVLYVSKDYWPLNTALWVKEFKKVTPIYALFFLRSLKLENYNGGAAVPTLNRNDVHRIESFEPPEKLLEAFTDHLSPIFKQIDILVEQNSKLSDARDLLLPRLMNGEIVV